MYPADDENKFKNLTDGLKNLKKIEAPVGFENKLWNKINSDAVPEKKSLWDKVFVKLLPATAVVATAVILFVVIENNAYEYQDPLLMEPEVRTDLIEIKEENQALQKFELENEPEIKSEKPKQLAQEKPSVTFRKKDSEAEVITMESPLAGRNEILRDEDSLAPESTGVTSSLSEDSSVNDQQIAPSATMKQGLNFRQVQLTEQEKQELNELKTRILKENQRK